MSSQPKPRPRPRKAGAPKAVSSDPTSDPPAGSHSGRGNTLEDEDAFFIKNRTRTAKDWQGMAKLAQAPARRARSPPSSSDVEIDPETESDDSITTQVKPKKKRPKTPPRRAKWAQFKANAAEPESDDDVTQSIDVASSETSPTGAKRKRSRSRSITPPPPLAANIVENARRLIREAVGIEQHQRAPSPIRHDESLDNIILDPELAEIARQVKSHPARPHYHKAHSGGSPEVNIAVRWLPYPLDQAAQPQIWKFLIKRDDPFRILFEQIADKAHILVNNLVVTYQGSYVYSSSTPHTLDMWAEAELQACDKLTHEHIRTHKQQPAEHNVQSPARDRSPSLLPFAEDATEAPSSELELNSQGDTFRLIIRSGTTADVTLTVRQTTTCGAIVAAFLKKSGITKKYPKNTPWLVIDGDKMGTMTPISEADLEDGNVVDVGGL